MTIDQQNNLVIYRERVFHNALWTFAGQILPLIVLFIALPIFIRSLGIERFGAFTLVLTFFTYLNLLDFGIGLGMTHFLANSLAKGDNKEFRTLMDTALFLQAALGCVSAIVLYFLLPYILHWFHLSEKLHWEVYGSLVFLVFSLPLALFTGGLRSVLNANQRMDVVNILDIFLTVFRLTGMLLIAVHLNNLEMIFAFLAFSQLIGLFIFIFYTVRFVPGKKGVWLIDFTKVTIFFQYGGWLTVSSIVGPIMVYFDRFLLGIFLGITVVPFYTVPYDIITRLWVFPAAICTPFFPVLSALHSRDKIASMHIFIKTIRFLLISLFPIILFVLIFSKEGLMLLLGPDFAIESCIILQLLSCGVLINSLAQLANNFIIASGRTDITAKFHIGELLLYLPLLYVLIRKFGIKGAAIAWVLRVCVDALLLFLAIFKLFSIKWSYIREISVSLVASLLILAFSLLNFNLISKSVYWVSSVILYVISIWKFAMDEEDRLWVRGLMRLPG